jgi:penicillin-binding protein 1C
MLQRLASSRCGPQTAIRSALEPVLLARDQGLGWRHWRGSSRQPATIRTTLDAALQRRLEDLLLGWRALIGLASAF